MALVIPPRAPAYQPKKIDFINAIKLTRYITGMGLRDSKDLIDANFPNPTSRDLDPDAFGEFLRQIILEGLAVRPSLRSNPTNITQE